MEALETAGAVAGDLDFSLFALFMAADWVIKAVMLGLLWASVWSWAIVVDKWFSFGKARREMNRFEKVFWSGQSLEELYQSIGRRPARSMAALFVAAMREWKRSVESTPKPLAGLQMRVEKVLDVALSREIDRLEQRLLFLATALGLLAAIPAVIFYNKFTHEVSRHAQRLESFADEFSAILSRQMDARG